MIDNVAGEQSTFPDVQPANDMTVALFFAVATQWNYAGMTGARTGLNYQAIEIRASKIPAYKELPDDLLEQVWDGIGIMERVCLTVWSQQSK